MGVFDSQGNRRAFCVAEIPELLEAETILHSQNVELAAPKKMSEVKINKLITTFSLQYTKEFDDIKYSISLPALETFLSCKSGFRYSLPSLEKKAHEKLRACHYSTNQKLHYTKDEVIPIINIDYLRFFICFHSRAIKLLKA